jgi:hypothetical protein
MNRLNSHFLAHLLLLQRSLVVKLGVSPSRSRSLTRSHSLSSVDSTTGHRPQCWDEVSPHYNYLTTNLPVQYVSRSSKWSPGYGSEAGSCEHGNEPSSSIKDGEIFDNLRLLSASQEGLSFIRTSHRLEIEPRTTRIQWEAPLLCPH